MPLHDRHRTPAAFASPTAVSALLPRGKERGGGVCTLTHMRASGHAGPPRAAVPVPQVYEGVSWGTVTDMASDLVAAAREGRYDVILAVTRGGLVPATLVCEGLGVRNVLSATVIFYTDAGEQFFGLRVPRFLCFPSVDQLAGRRVLVVDDVWDSGRTAFAVRERVLRTKPEVVHVAVLHYKPSCSIVGGEPEFYARQTENWIVYPWERLSPDVPHVDVEEGAHGVELM